jgi:hypothetical protein
MSTSKIISGHTFRVITARTVDVCGENRGDIPLCLRRDDLAILQVEETEEYGLKYTQTHVEFRGKRYLLTGLSSYEYLGKEYRFSSVILFLQRESGGKLVLSTDLPSSLTTWDEETQKKGLAAHKHWFITHPRSDDC